MTAALVPLLVFPRPWSLIAALACTAVVVAACIRTGALGGRCAVRQACWTADGQWWLKDGSGVTASARLLSDSRVFAHWVWLSWDSPLGPRQVVLLRNAGQGAVVRRLAVRLRLQGALSDASPDTLSM